MAGKADETRAIYREFLMDDCELVIMKNGWLIQFDAKTWDEDEDMMYKVTSDKISQFLQDLRKNLNLYLELKEAGKPLSKDGEGLRGMVIKFKGDKPGVYLNDTYWIASTQSDYDRIDALMKKAVDRASKIHETL